MDQGVLGVDSEHWRKAIMALPNIEAFNPFVANWTPQDAEKEARALATCDFVVMAITTVTDSIGSLGESGWIFNACEKRGIPMVVWIQQYDKAVIAELKAKAKSDPKFTSVILASNQARTTIAAHLNENHSAFLTVCDNYFSLMNKVIEQSK